MPKPPRELFLSIEYLKAFLKPLLLPLATKRHWFPREAHLQHKLPSGILVNLFFHKQNSSSPRSPVLREERCVIIVRDDSMTSKGETKQQLSHQSAPGPLKF